VEHVDGAAQQLDLKPRALAAAAPVRPERPAPAAPAESDPLLGDTAAELGEAAPPDEAPRADDWLEPVAPVLDEVIRTFDPDPAPEAAQPAPARAPGSDRDDPLEWSLLDLAADAGESEPPEAPRTEELAGLPGSKNEDDSMANLSFADELAAQEVEPEAIELEDALDEPLLEHDEELDPGPAAHVGPAPGSKGPAKGPRIDLPEDDDLDLLFDDIQIES
jgi:hypothetical protein